ncbi:MAG: hypothetical protein JJU45_15360 [Acidimicrobiia bacterium]|nr:hypothetical protein [Acidimicrobiia bacterium]
MTEGERPPSDVIRLTLPGDPAYGSIARTAAMTLGLRAGFDWPTLERLALAVDEAMVLLLTGHPSETQLDLTFHSRPGELQLDARAAGTDAWDDPVDPDESGPGDVDDSDVDVSPPAVERFAGIVTGVVDHWSVDTDERTLRLRVGGESSDPPQ